MAAIDQKINLIGVPQVTQGLDQIVAKTKQATDAINSVGTSGGPPPLTPFNDALKRTEEGFKATEGAGRGFAEALHILHPIIGELGGSLGELGTFARLSSAGFAAFAAALGGTLLVAMEKAGEAADNLKRKLTFQFGAQGAQNFETIKKAVDETKASISDLAPAFAAAEAAFQRTSSFRSVSPEAGGGFSTFFGTPQDREKLEKDITALTNLLKQGGLSASEAAKQAGAFIISISQFDKTRPDKTIGLTADAFARLQSEGSLIATALQNAGVTLDSLSNKNLAFKDTLDKLANVAPIYNKLKPPDNITTAIDDVKHSWEGLLEKLAERGAFGLASGFLEGLAHQVDLFADDINAVIDAIKKLQEERDKFVKAGSPGAGGELSVAAEQSAFAKLPINIRQARDALSELTTGFGIAKQQALDLGAAVDSVMKDIITNVNNAAKSASTTFGTGKFVAPPGGEVPTFPTLFPPAAGVPSQQFPSGGHVPNVLKPGGSQDETTGDIKKTGSAVDELNTSLTTLGQNTAVSGLLTQFTSLDDEVGNTSESLTQLATDLSSVDVSSFVSAVQQAANISFDSQASQVTRLATAFGTAADNAIRLASAESSGSGGSQILTVAGGGLIVGPGTGTSDSIFARLSAGEFVMTAAAVQRYGAAFFASLNAGMPRFAGGGAVSDAKTTVNLNFAPNASFQMTTSEAVATSLRQYATKSRYISIGPKPSWY